MEDSNYYVAEIYEPEAQQKPEKRKAQGKKQNEDLPRERLLNNGAESLKKEELLAILIGSGTQEENVLALSAHILNDCDNNLQNLCRMTYSQLTDYPGIGMAKAVTILAATELAKRLVTESEPKKPLLDDAEKVYEYMRPRIGYQNTEEGWVLLQNNKMQLKKAVRLSSGGITETAIDLRVIMREALYADATVITLCHNHPSGSLQPSMDDTRLTRSLKEACRLMRIHLADHVIITANGYYSFLENEKL